MSPIYDKYTERAKRTLALATEEARRFNHNYIGTEHLLLGLVRGEEGIAARVLADLGVDIGKTRSAVEFIIGRGERVNVGDISLTPRAKKAIEFATEESRRLGHNYIGTEHILLGMVREGEGIAVGILETLGVDLDKLRQRIIQAVASPGAPARQGLPAATGEAAQRQAADRLGYTPAARKALRLAADEARRLGRSEVGAGHLLLGLARDEEGIAAGILVSLGVNLEQVRQRVMQAGNQEPE